MKPIELGMVHAMRNTTITNANLMVGTAQGAICGTKKIVRMNAST
jgi:hypothetical protein